MQGLGLNTTTAVQSRATASSLPHAASQSSPRGDSASAQVSATRVPEQSPPALRELGLLRGASGQGRTLSAKSRSGTAVPSGEPQWRPSRDVGGAGTAAPPPGTRGCRSGGAAAVTFHVPSPRRGTLAAGPSLTQVAMAPHGTAPRPAERFNSGRVRPMAASTAPPRGNAPTRPGGWYHSAFTANHRSDAALMATPPNQQQSGTTNGGGGVPAGCYGKVWGKVPACGDVRENPAQRPLPPAWAAWTFLRE